MEKPIECSECESFYGEARSFARRAASAVVEAGGFLEGLEHHGRLLEYDTLLLLNRDGTWTRAVE